MAKTFTELPCLKCGKTDTCSLSLSDLDTLLCSECEEESSLENDIIPAIEEWNRVARWVAAASGIQ